MARDLPSALSSSNGRLFRLNSTFLAKTPMSESLWHIIDLVSGESFILKKFYPEAMTKQLRLKELFGNEPLLLLHFDHIVPSPSLHGKDNFLFYKFFGHNSLDLMCVMPNEISSTQRIQSLKDIAMSLRTLHAQGWAYGDLKPKKVLIDATRTQQGWTINRTALSILSRAQHEDDIPERNENPESLGFRSPEGLAGDVHGTRGKRSSNVFSFGLLCLSIIHGTIWRDSIWFSVPAEIQDLRPVNSVQVCYLMLLGMPDQASQSAFVVSHLEYLRLSIPNFDSLVSGDTEQFRRLENWPEHAPGKGLMLPETKAFLLRMLRWDPAQRPSMEQILEDPWWKRYVFEPASSTSHGLQVASNL